MLQTAEKHHNRTDTATTETDTVRAKRNKWALLYGKNLHKANYS